MHQTEAKINAFDGLVYMPDGTRVFPDGTPVDGVNDYVQLGSRGVVFNAEGEWSEKELDDIEFTASDITVPHKHVQIMQTAS